MSLLGRRVRNAAVKPHEDYGFFGPHSVAWRVWSYPTSLTIGFQRAVVVEELDPFLIAAVDATNRVRYQPRVRYDRTLRYFATAAFGDARSAIKASEILVKVHAKAVGIEPISGNRYDANDPDSQMWIHLTAWHSILYAYERYGPGPLSPEDERRYWKECAIAAELQTCDPAKVPSSRDGIREYFEEVRPRLAGSEAAQSMMDHLLDAEVMFPPLPRAARPGAWVVNKVLRIATIATMPRWMRELANLRQPAFLDRAIVPLMRVVFRVVAMSARLQLLGLGLISPSTRPVVEPVFRAVPPLSEETLTPAEARARYGAVTPSELYARIQHGAQSRDGELAPVAGVSA
jgi:uncharacterized protein (DUF2236 family)